MIGQWSNFHPLMEFAIDQRKQVVASLTRNAKFTFFSNSKFLRTRSKTISLDLNVKLKIMVE
jgi:hypothetical protein